MFSLKKHKTSAMAKLQAKSGGFTIVELLIVIVVIGILATLVIVTFSGIQQKGRNSQRQTDINTVTTYVSAYYTEKGYYPTLTDMNDATWRSNNAKGLDPEALKDPRGNAQTLVGTTTANSYVYTVGGTGCVATTASSDTNACDSYTLTATLEPSGTYVKQSN